MLHASHFKLGKVQAKIFLWIHDLLEIFLCTLRYIASDNSPYRSGVFDHGKNYHNIIMYLEPLHYSYSISYIILLTLLLCSVRCSLVILSHAFIDQSLLAPVWRQPGNVRKVHVVTGCSSR